ncbi:hypothetical protein Tco_0986929 [Tanacetum coccineum]
MHLYWASEYLLSNEVIKEIDKQFKRLLQNYGDLAQGKCRVAWKLICRPKDYGDLGKNLLELRDTTKDHVMYKIGGGKDTSMSHDRWCTMGPLDGFIPKREVYELILKDDITIVEMVENGTWKWPQEWYVRFPVLNNIQVPILNDTRKDSVLWIDGNNKYVQYSTKTSWTDLKEHWPQFEWYNVVWLSKFNRRQAFIL